MPCEHCQHCKAVEAAEAALAAQSQDSFDGFVAVPAVQTPNLEVPSLNDHQLATARTICNNYLTDKLHYVEGVSGTGKTYLLNAMYALFKNMNLKVDVISPGPFPTPNVARQLKDVLHFNDEMCEELDVLLIDNANQIDEQQMKSLCEKLKKVMKNDQPFGGKTIVLAADFGQLLPFSTTCKTKQQKLRETLKHLTDNSVAPFTKHTLPCGDGDWSKFLGMVRKSPSVTIPDGNIVKSIDELIEFTYGALQAEAPHTDGIIITCKNTDVEIINNLVLDKMKRKFQIFEASLNAKIIKGDLDLHTLKLKKNCLLLLEEQYEGIPKGTRLVFEETNRNKLCCRVVGTNQQVDLLKVNRFLGSTPKSPMSKNSAQYKETKQCVLQYPVSVGFAQTTHGVQGRHFDKVAIFKPDQFFDHGMLYTAVSRATSAEGLKIHTQSAVIKNPGLEMSLVE